MTHTTDQDNLAAHVALADQTVADIGCGAGGLVRWLRTKGAEPVGVECGDIMRARALEADPDNALDYVNAYGQDLPFEDESFDVVTFIYSLHHVPGDEMTNALREAHRILKPGGIAYVAEPVAEGPGHEVDRLVDDETEVRRQAQAALDEAPAIGFERGEQGSYETLDVYADFEEYEGVMVGVDPTRKAAMAAARDASEQKFHENGTPHPDGISFSGRVVFDVLTRR
jgi:ubiquinone/menaquinone biosynthesis C-methylase UbiE